MKKFLSLVLALVMTMSLVTVSAGAKDFTDSTKIQYAEAVDVMSAVKVIDGYADGSFNPSATLTRGAAAKIICNLILGPTTASALVADAAPYKDVPVNHTFAGYIAYCQKTGIISGYADGTFKPANTLTGYAFMKMLLGALGYDAANEGYVGPNWSIAVAKQAINAGLNKGLTGSFNGVKAVTREEACLYAFNTLKATMVEYTTQTIVVNNGSVSTNKTAKSMEWVGAEKAYDGEKDGKVQFCEKYFEKLTAKYDTDDFERPVTTWSNDKKEVGTYIRNDLLVKEYTDAVSGLDMYNLLGKSVVEDKEYTFTIAIDGIEGASNLVNKKGDTYSLFTRTNISKNNKDDLSGTGLGVLTQVFQDTDSKEVYIAVINTYLAKASDDYDAKKEQAKFTVYAVDKKSNEYVLDMTQDETNVVADNDDIDVTGVKEDEFYLVTMAAGQVQTLEKAETVANTEISSFKLTDSVTAGGTKYEYAETARYAVDVLDQYTGGKTNLKETTYNIFLDAYGNLIGVEKVDEDDNYVFIAGVDTNGSNLSAKNYDATAIFTDGTYKTITFKNDKSTGVTATNLAVVNKWFTYTVDKDGVYTLKAVAGSITSGVKAAQYHSSAASDIDKKNIALPIDASTGAAYGNDKSIYISAKLKSIINKNNDESVIISDVDNVTTGIKNASLTAWAVGTSASDTGSVWAKKTTSTFTLAATTDISGGVYTLYNDKGYVIAAVVVGEDNEASKNLVYVNSKSIDSETYDKVADEWTWTREVILNGEKTTLTEKGDSLTYLDTMQRYGWYQVKFNAKGEVVGIVNETSTPDTWSLTTANGTNHGDYVKNITYLADSIRNGKDTVLYTEAFGTNAATADANEPSMKGNTLYVDKTLTKGFYVDEDAKVVFVQTNKGKTTTEVETGSDKVQSFVESLNQKNGAKYFFTISAILENGAAKVVVINDGIDNTVGGSTVTGSTGIYTGSLKKVGSGLEFNFQTTDAAAPADWSGVTYTLYGKNTTSGYTSTVVAKTAATGGAIAYAGSNPWHTTSGTTVLATSNDNWVYWAEVTFTGTTGDTHTIVTSEIAG